jgi:hypothetical protein
VPVLQWPAQLSTVEHCLTLGASMMSGPPTPVSMQPSLPASLDAE